MNGPAKISAGCLFLGDSTAKAPVKHKLILEQLEKCCDRIFAVGEKSALRNTDIPVFQSFSQLPVDKNEAVVIVTDASFCFSAKRAATYVQRQGGDIVVAKSLLSSFGAPGGFLIASAKAGDTKIREIASGINNESAEYFPLDNDCKMEWERTFEVFEFPKIVKLELTNRCNFKCKMCLFHGDAYRKAPTYVSKEQFQDMNFELYKKGIDECAEWAAKLPYDIQVFLANRGESLLYGDIVDAVSYASRKGVGIYLTTNAALLSSEMSSKLMEAGIRQITLSLDGLDKEELSKIRINSEKYDVFNNLETLLSIKEKNGFSTNVSVCFTKLSDNEGQMQRFINKYLPRVNAVMVQAKLAFDESKKGKITTEFFARLPDENRQVCPALFGIGINADSKAWICPCANQQADSYAGKFDAGTSIFTLYHNLDFVRRCHINAEYSESLCCTPCDVWMSYYTVSKKQGEGFMERTTPIGKFFSRTCDVSRTSSSFSRKIIEFFKGSMLK